MSIVLRCHAGIGPSVIGAALVAADNFSARYDLDRNRGIFSRRSHKLAGESYVDRILVLDGAKGGVATAWMLHDMASRGLVPRALIFNRVNPIIAQGAAFAGVALVTYMSSLTTIGYTATQYALLSSTYAYLGKILKGTSGALVDYLSQNGHTLMSAYGIFFLISGAIGIPGVILCVILARAQSGRRQEKQSLQTEKA